ncbi:starch-binding domain protein (macronuclear) [Tetrahymena thermophila SB210]|uniref:Starch-binding domain protein n=1 Tax=Tetrahymena thermophila (strain SB210) TaxID=312017 RepID=I7M481_TETTS|nr:starch-binding domain protein [Tetrahymena thermophila SB210]EAS05131.1 starch-binding domain protein [Tetrahymena thermophila SB210]|eukprot:XP_001025376.1 starch-binding domain protein [Tetrahymena thermophila SB210]
MSNQNINKIHLHNDIAANHQQQHLYGARADPIQRLSSTNQLCIVNWQISYQTNYGERLAIVGNIHELGNWKKEEALNLQWNNNNIWNGQIIINLNGSSNVQKILEYKYILIDEKNQKVQWEEGQNRFYYYSQILAESQEKENILFRNSKIFDDQFNQCNNILRYQHPQQRLQSQLNTEQSKKCTNQIFIYDVWNKKSIIFRIKDMICQNYEIDNQNIETGNKEQNLESHQNLIQNPQSLENQYQYSRNLIQECSSSPYFDSSSAKIQEEQGEKNLENQEINNLIHKQNKNKKIYYITGNHKELGNLRNPQKMNYIPENQSWELQIFVDRSTEYIRYFYIQKEGNNQLEWEKGSGRFIYMQPLNDEQNFNASAIGSCKQSSIQSSHSLSEIDFEDLKTELLIQSQNRTINSNSINHKLMIESIQNNQDNKRNFQSKNSINKRLQGKIQVNTLNKGVFLCENNEVQLDFSLSFDSIFEYLYLGPYISNNISDIRQLKKFGIDTVLSLQTDDDMQRRSVDIKLLKEQYKKSGIEYYNIPIKDKSFQDFYHKGLSAVEKLNTLLKNQKRIVYLHCTGGISRAPQTAILYLSLYKNYSLKNAIKYVCSKREAAFPDEQLMHLVYNNVFENSQG